MKNKTRKKVTRKNPVGDSMDQKLRASAVRREFRKFRKALGSNGLPKKVREAVDQNEAWWHAKRRKPRLRKGTPRKIAAGVKRPTFSTTQFTLDPMGYIGDTSIVFADVATALQQNKVKSDEFPLAEFHALEGALKRAESTFRKDVSTYKWGKTEGAPDGGPTTPGFLTRSNPGFGLNTNMVIGGAVVGTGAWLAWRFQQRAALVRLLNGDPGIKTIKATFGPGTNRLPPSDLAWLVVPGGMRKRAAEVIPIFGTNNALQGYNQIMEEMPAVELTGQAVTKADQVITGIEGVTGLNLPDISSLFESVPAHENPHMEWDEYLDHLTW